MLCIFLTIALRGLVPLWTQRHSWLAIMTVAAALTGAAWYTLPPETSTLMMGSAGTDAGIALDFPQPGVSQHLCQQTKSS